MDTADPGQQPAPTRAPLPVNQSPRWGTQRTASRAWRKLRLTILERDGHQCTALDGGVRCTTPANQVDHIVATAFGGTDDPSNLTSLCLHHHRIKTSWEGNEARRRRAAQLRRPPEPHPGLIEPGGDPAPTPLAASCSLAPDHMRADARAFAGGPE